MTSAPDTTPDRLQDLVDRLAARDRVPHAIVGVARTDGSSPWVGAAGPADAGGAPARADTPYFIASVTKLYIATAVLQLHEQGAIDLDAPMTHYLSDDLIGGLHRMDGRDHTAEITARHLLSHTSGLPDHLEDKRRGERSLAQQLTSGHDRGWTLEDVVRIARRLGPHFPPRALHEHRVKARYSDTGFQLLIAIVEAVTGRGAHEVMAEQLFEPLGLRHTWWPGRTEPPASAPPPAAIWSKGRPLELPLAVSSLNDLYSTAGDTLRFLSALVHGEVFDRPATSGLMQERWNRIFYPLRYGLGMMRYKIAAPFGGRHGGATLVGHSGSTGSWLFHCPERDLLLTGTVNDVAGRRIPYQLIPRLLRVVGSSW